MILFQYDTRERERRCGQDGGRAFVNLVRGFQDFVRTYLSDKTHTCVLVFLGRGPFCTMTRGRSGHKASQEVLSLSSLPILLHNFAASRRYSIDLTMVISNDEPDIAVGGIYDAPIATAVPAMLAGT